MSKISVTTIAGLTSGGDANTVKIESGDYFVVDTNVLKVDSSNNRVGIGTASPTQDLTIVNSGSARMELISGTSGTSIIDMGDSADGDIGGIRYAQGTDTLQFRAGNDVRMSIDGSGRLTIPNQPSFFVGASGQTAATNEITSWGSGNVKHNIGSHFSESSGRFTAPVAGRYFFAFNSLQNGNGSQMTAIIRINSGNLGIYVRTDGDSSEHHHTSGSGIFNLAANDYVSIYVTGGSAYGDTSTYWTSFHGHLLS